MKSRTRHAWLARQADTHQKRVQTSVTHVLQDRVSLQLGNVSALIAKQENIKMAHMEIRHIRIVAAIVKLGSTRFSLENHIVIYVQ